MPDNIDSLNVLGTRISPVNMEVALERIATWIADSQTGRYVCVTGVHGVMESLRDRTIRQIHNHADICVPDGMPMTWLGRLKGHSRMDRVYGPDLMRRLLERAAKEGWSNYFYGGKPGVAEDLRVRTQAMFPGLKVVGTTCPPFRGLTVDEERDILKGINSTRPDLLWIGLSTPKQEKQMASFKDKVQAKVMIGVGAAFDFLTGGLRATPAWLQRAGLEWFFRLCMEPRRLGPRYLRNNPAFLWHIFLQLSGLRRYGDEE